MRVAEILKPNIGDILGIIAAIIALILLAVLMFLLLRRKFLPSAQEFVQAQYLSGDGFMSGLSRMTYAQPKTFSGTSFMTADAKHMSGTSEMTNMGAPCARARAGPRKGARPSR